MLDLKGKTALITGAAKRLGKGLALALASLGVNIVAHYHRSEQEIDDLLLELESFPIKAFKVQADLSETAALDSMFSAVLAKTAAVDILINNASVFNESVLASFSFDELSSEIKVNSFAPLFLARRFCDQTNEGVIVNLLDARMQDYDKKHVAYHLSKRMLFSLTKMLAVEFAPKVRVNAVAPGLVLPSKGQDVAYLENLAHTNLLNTYGSLTDINEAVLFLLQARFITGQIIYVDGGRNLIGNMYGA